MLAVALLAFSGSPAFAEVTTYGQGKQDSTGADLIYGITDSNTTNHPAGDLRGTDVVGVVKKETATVDTNAPVDPMIAVCAGTFVGPVSDAELAQCSVATPNLNKVADPTPPAVIDFARQSLNSVKLPIPQPEISAPNGGICGVTHSLDLHMDVEKIITINDQTFGPETLHLYGYVTVNWGDGSTGHYTTGGAPYPNSSITHAWTTKGFYNITVTATWSAHITIGPYQGQTYNLDVGGLTTRGSIQNWRVWEAQAVITS